MNRTRMDHDERLNRLLAELPEARRGDLLHLLSCPVCQGAARKCLGAEREADPREPGADYGPILDALEAQVPELVRRMEEQSAGVRRLFERLMAHPAERQIPAARSPEFRSLDLADLLLRESESAQPGDPMRAEGLARLALPIAEQRYGRAQAERISEIKARALVLLGNARRLQKDLVEAEDRFRGAAFHLTGPPDDVTRGLYCRMLAALRQDQRRGDEAAGLLWRAAGIYEANGDLLEEAACRAELGFLLLAADQVHEAVSPLARAVPVLDLHRDVLLGLRARLALAVCYARTGHGEKARALVAAARPQYSHLATSEQMAEAVWMEGKVALLAGDREEADSLLRTARNSLLSAGRLYDAALATLDLVLALPKARRRLADLHPLLHEIAERFPRGLDFAEVLRALGAVEMAVAACQAAPFEEVVALAAERLRRVRRYPQLRFMVPAGLARSAQESEAEAPVVKA